MREIKFRAWDSTNKKMVRVRQMLIPDNNNENGVQEFSISGLKFGTNPSHWLITPPLMQYTGLKDKNGKEIYEGDLIRYSKADVCRKPAEVYWEENGCQYRLATGGDRQFDKTRMINFATIGEVIGNIYESKELLKGEHGH